MDCEAFSRYETYILNSEKDKRMSPQVKWKARTLTPRTCIY